MRRLPSRAAPFPSLTSASLRSIKAIETPYQVHFLFQYVAFLQQEHAAAAAASRNTPPS